MTVSWGRRTRRRGGMVRRHPSLAVPELGPCASSGRAWRLWDPACNFETNLVSSSLQPHATIISCTQDLRAEPSLCALAQRLCSEYSQGARDAAVDDNLDLPRNLMDEVSHPLRYCPLTAATQLLPHSSPLHPRISTSRLQLFAPRLQPHVRSLQPHVRSLQPHVPRASARAASTRATPSSLTWTVGSSRRAARASAAGCSTRSTAPRAS